MNHTSKIIQTSLLAAGIFAAASAAIAAEEINHLHKGDKIPAVTVQNDKGESIDLQAAVAKAPTVLISYRGGWCPYCNTHLGELSEIEEQLTAAGAQILAISPDQPSKIHDAPKRKVEPAYQLLSDHSMTAAEAFGIAYEVDEKTYKTLLGYDINLEEASGETHHKLPHPAVFVASPDGTIHFSYVNADYKVRLDPAKILAVGKKVAAMKPTAN
jgi:peroxiredoxin